MKIVLDPDIDTLFFSSEDPFDLAKFLVDAGEEDPKSLRPLAINEYAFSIWNTPKLFLQLGFLMMGLERLMIGTYIAGYQEPLYRTTEWDRWDGWLFGGGLPTGAECLTLLGRTREHIFSTQTLHGQLIYFPSDDDQYLFATDARDISPSRSRWRWALSGRSLGTIGYTDIVGLRFLESRLQILTMSLSIMMSGS